MKSAKRGRSFFSYYFSYFAMPGRAIADLLGDSRRVRLAVYAMVIPTAGYTLMYTLAWFAGGALSAVKPWLAIPMEQYFKYDIFIAAPSMFMAWVLAAGVVQLLGRLASSRGTFEDSAAVLGFGIATATWASLVHDLTDAVLSVLGVIDMKAYEAALNGPTFWRVLLWTLYSIYALWMIALFARGLRRAHGLGWGVSVALGLAGAIVYMGIFFVFNR